MVFSRALHRKKKIATVLKLTKLKMKRSNELRKFTRGENEQLQKTSGADVLSSRKQNQKSLMMEGGGGGHPHPVTSEG